MPKLVLYTERQSGAKIIETKAKYAPSPQNNVAKLFLTERIAFNYFQHCKWGEGDAFSDEILSKMLK